MGVERNKALVVLLADSGLRISETLRLRIEDVHLGERTLLVRCGKGGKDGTGFFGAELRKSYARGSRFTRTPYQRTTCSQTTGDGLCHATTGPICFIV